MRFHLIMHSSSLGALVIGSINSFEDMSVLHGCCMLCSAGILAQGNMVIYFMANCISYSIYEKKLGTTLFNISVIPSFFNMYIFKVIT